MSAPAREPDDPSLPEPVDIDVPAARADFLARVGCSPEEAMADKIVVHIEAGEGRITEVGERVFADVGDQHVSIPVPQVSDRRALGAHLYRRCSVQVIFVFDPADEHDAAPEVTA